MIRKVLPAPDGIQTPTQCFVLPEIVCDASLFELDFTTRRKRCCPVNHCQSVSRLHGEKKRTQSTQSPEELRSLLQLVWVLARTSCRKSAHDYRKRHCMHVRHLGIVWYYCVQPCQHTVIIPMELNHELFGAQSLPSKMPWTR